MRDVGMGDFLILMLIFSMGVPVTPFQLLLGAVLAFLGGPSQ